MSLWTGDSGLYLWKEQEFKKVEEVYFYNFFESFLQEIKGVNLKMSQWTGNSGLYLWKEQEFKKVEEVWPLLKMKNKVGHTSSTILNSCFFFRDIGRLLFLLDFIYAIIYK